MIQSLQNENFISIMASFEREDMSKNKELSIDAETNINDYYDNQDFLQQENVDFLGNSILENDIKNLIESSNPSFIKDDKEGIQIKDNSTIKKSSKRKRKKAEKQTFEISSYSFFYSILVMSLTLGYLTYNISQVTFSLAVIMLLICSGFFLISFKSFNQKLVISKNNIYVFEKEKRIYTWNLINDYNTCHFRQGPIQKLFNCGNLTIVNKDSKYLLIKNVSNVQESFESIILNYEELLTNMGIEFESYFDKQYIENKKHKNSSNAQVDIDKVETQTAFDFEENMKKSKRRSK